MEKGGKVIVLTERSERNAVLVELEALSGKEPRIILATGTLAQYAGRLNHICVGKRDLRVYDYVDIGDPRLRGMWNKREHGYRALGYTIRHIE